MVSWRQVLPKLYLEIPIWQKFDEGKADSDDGKVGVETRVREQIQN